MEFKCPECTAVLRVDDSDAGKKAQCPSCNAICDIPEIGIEKQTTDENADARDAAFATSFNPYAVSGEMEREVEGSGPIKFGAEQGITFRRVCNTATNRWMESIGPMLLVSLFLLVVGVADNGISSVADVIAEESVDREAELAARIFSLVSQLAFNLFQTFLGVGLAKMSLAMVRCQPISFGMLFSGGDRFLPVLLMTILYGLATLFGLILLIVPGILVLIFFWPYHFLIIDRRVSATGSFPKSFEITSQNAGEIFLLGLFTLGVYFIGLLVCCVGIFPGHTFAYVLWATMYCLLCGENIEETA